MVVCDLLRFFVMLAIAAVAALDGPVLLVVLLVGLTTLFGMPYSPAFYASLPRLVPERDLASADSLVSTSRVPEPRRRPRHRRPARDGGIPVLGVAVKALTFLVSALFVLRATVPGRAERGGRGRRRHDRGHPLGIRTLTGDRVLATLSVALLAITFIYGFELVYLVLVARDLLDMGASGVGYLDAAVGVGGLLGAVIAPRLARSTTRGR